MNPIHQYNVRKSLERFCVAPKTEADLRWTNLLFILLAAGLIVAFVYVVSR